jgi:hypothetical protein
MNRKEVKKMAEVKTTSNNSMLTTVIVAVLVGALAFFGGMQYQKSRGRALGNGVFGQGGQFGRRAGANGLRPTNGQIVSSDDKSVTVKMPDGSTKIVLITDKTVINKASTGTKDDLKNGETVVVFGTANSDGSVSAQNIAIGGGMFRGLRGGPNGGNTYPSPTQ